jgi:anti-sigma regulatory factor (Ser/Thr protein kinase)/anti-anti-sigma regulatory factor
MAWTQRPGTGMPMEITLSEGTGYLLVRPCGCLSLRTVTHLRDVLLKAAAEQPRGIVCDLREIWAAGAALTILHVVADQVADWPGTPVVLVVEDPAVGRQLDRLGLARRFTVVADLGAAAAALRHAPGFLVSSMTLPPTEDAPATARAFVAAALGRWQAEVAADVARWVVSELVTNAVVHARSEITVRVSLWGRRVGLAVGDRGPGGIKAPLLPGVDGGWGLTVVDELTRSWGVLPRLTSGWVVWAVVDGDRPGARVVPQQSARRV